MVFSSLIFIFRFLPAFLTVYVLTPRRCRNLTLFLASLVFYAWGEPVYVGLMLFSALLDYGNGRVLEYAKRAGRRSLARAVLAESVLVNLSLLCAFKYSGKLPLPVGISFYTFQTMSYTIDVYRGETPAQKSLTAFGAYVAMFPQLIAGPVVKYRDVAGELERRTLDPKNGYAGIGRFCTGLGKKVLLANQIGLLWENVQKLPPGQMSTLTAWLGSAAYALQLYFDFSGYSDMAIGMARMLGFHLKENFDYPYRSASITEFWRRWHISLGQWFREYVYIPLGGNKRGRLIQIRNILIVWALTGIWHGKGWNFLAWGLYFGVLLILEKRFLCAGSLRGNTPLTRRTGRAASRGDLLVKWLERLRGVCGRLYVMIAVLMGMTIFALESLPEGLAYLAALWGNTSCFLNGETVWLLSDYGPLLLICIAAAVGWGRKLADVPAVWILSFLLSVAYLADAAYNPFLYFRF